MSTKEPRSGSPSLSPRTTSSSSPLAASTCRGEEGRRLGASCRTHPPTDAAVLQPNSGSQPLAPVATARAHHAGLPLLPEPPPARQAPAARPAPPHLRHKLAHGVVGGERVAGQANGQVAAELGGGRGVELVDAARVGGQAKVVPAGSGERWYGVGWVGDWCGCGSWTRDWEAGSS